MIIYNIYIYVEPGTVLLIPSPGLYIHLVLWVFSFFVTWQGIQSTATVLFGRPGFGEMERDSLLLALCLQDMTRSEMLVQDDYWCVQRFGVGMDQENTIDWLHPKQSAWLVWNVWLIFKFSVPCTFFFGSWFCFLLGSWTSKAPKIINLTHNMIFFLNIEFIQPCWAKKFRKNSIFKFVPARMLTVTLISWRRTSS